jgi:hypothetical protein
MNDDDGMLIQGEVRAPTQLSAELCAQSIVLRGVLCLTKPVFVPVVNLSALAGQPVQRLVLSSNSVQRVEFDADDARSDALELEEMVLDNNRIELMPDTLAPRLPRLHSLSLARNALLSFESIAQFVNLRTLDLRHNHVGAESLAHLAPLTQLRDLSLASCALTSVEPLPATLVHLVRLSLACNRLANLQSCVAVLARFPALRHVLLECNPLTLLVHRVRVLDSLGHCELVPADASVPLSLDVDMFDVVAYCRCALRRLLPALLTVDALSVSEFVEPGDFLLVQ